MLRPEALRFAESGLGILQRAGFAAFSPAHTLEEDRAAARSAVAALPADQDPRLTAAVDEAVAAMGGEEAFHYGLRILDGLELRLAAAH